MQSSSEPASVITVPLLTVQADFNQDLGDVLARRTSTSKFWLSLYNATGASKPTLHGTVTVTPESGSMTSINLKPADTPELRTTFLDTNSFSFTFVPASDAGELKATRVQSAARSYKGQGLPKSINCLDVSPQGDLLLIGGPGGALNVVDAKDGTVRRDLIGHKADLECCRFFPSGKVALSGGMDLNIRIWDITDGSCAAQLKGHTRGVLDLAIVARGRNVLSCSRDGTLLLHEPASSSVISTIASLPDAINAISFGILPAGDFSAAELDSREVETE
jgi:proteasomal ATPase-associated factor 1